MTAGILPAARARRAKPLPNSVRGSATSFNWSDMGEVSSFGRMRLRARQGAHATAASITPAPQGPGLAEEPEKYSLRAPWEPATGWCHNHPNQFDGLLRLMGKTEG